MDTIRKELNTKYFCYLPIKIIAGEYGRSNFSVISAKGLLFLCTWQSSIIKLYDFTGFRTSRDDDCPLKEITVKCEQDVATVFYADLNYVLSKTGILYCLHKAVESNHLQLSYRGKVDEFDDLLSLCVLLNGFAFLMTKNERVWLYVAYTGGDENNGIVSSNIVEIDKSIEIDDHDNQTVDYIVYCCRKSAISNVLWKSLFPTAHLSDDEILLICYPNGDVYWMSTRQSSSVTDKSNRRLKLYRRFPFAVIRAEFAFRQDDRYSRLVFVLNNGETVVVRPNNKDPKVGSVVLNCCYDSFFLTGGYYITSAYLSSDNNDVLIFSDRFDTYLAKLSFTTNSTAYTTVCQSPVKGIVNLYPVAAAEMRNNVVFGITAYDLLYVIRTDVVKRELDFDHHDTGESITGQIVKYTAELQSIVAEIEKENKLYNSFTKLTRCREVREYIRLNVQVTSSKNIDFLDYSCCRATHYFKVDLKLDTDIDVEFEKDMWHLETTVVTEFDEHVCSFDLTETFDVEHPISVEHILYDWPDVHLIKRLVCRLIANNSNNNCPPSEDDDNKPYPLIMSLEECRLDATYFFATPSSEKDDGPFNSNNISRNIVVNLNSGGSDEKEADEKTKDFVVDIPSGTEATMEQILGKMLRNSWHRLRTPEQLLRLPEFFLTVGDEMVHFKISRTTDNRIQFVCENDEVGTYVKRSILRAILEDSHPNGKHSMSEEEYLNVESIRQQIEIERIANLDSVSNELISKAFKITEQWTDCRSDSDDEEKVN